MHFMQSLQQAWTRNNSLVCVGLDPEPSKFPDHLRGTPDAVFAFCGDVTPLPGRYAPPPKPPP